MVRDIKVAVAPDSFKGTLTAEAATEAICQGVLEAVPGARCLALPMADGGEGTAALLARVTGGEIQWAHTGDPLGRPLVAPMARLGDGVTWAVDVAAASGLPLLTARERDPLRTSSAGTGQLIRAALERGATGIVLGLGGSATVDGGVGLAQALGFRFLDSAGRDVAPGGGSLALLAHIDSSAVSDAVWRLGGRLRLACDVENPLVGPRGAARVFGPQKGARQGDVEVLEQGLERLARVLGEHRGSGDALPDVAALPGTGAAGGMGATLKVLLGASLEPGGALVMDAAGYRAQLAVADVVITGEGCLDHQTAAGKAPLVVAAAAQALGIPVLAVAGVLGKGAEALGVFEDWEAARSALAEGLPDPATAARELSAATLRLMRRWRARRGL